MPDMVTICGDLAAEHEALDALVAGLDEGGWDAPTPAPGWAVRDQVSHLAFFDDAARCAVTDEEAFRRLAAEAATDIDAHMRRHLERGRATPGPQVLGWWRDARAGTLAAFAPLDPSTRVPWYGPPMGAVSFATARLMETWAHGQDVADGLGVERKATDRLRHVAHIGVRAMPFSFAAHGLERPAQPVRVELRSPGGEPWEWGDEAADDRVSGPALDFCLVVTQRRHVADTDLVAEGEVARRWLSIAQSFAGPPGPGRRPGQFPRPR